MTGGDGLLVNWTEPTGSGLVTHHEIEPVEASVTLGDGREPLRFESLGRLLSEAAERWAPGWTGETWLVIDRASSVEIPLLRGFAIPNLDGSCLYYGPAEPGGAWWTWALFDERAAGCVDCEDALERIAATAWPMPERIELALADVDGSPRCGACGERRRGEIEAAAAMARRAAMPPFEAWRDPNERARFAAWLARQGGRR